MDRARRAAVAAVIRVHRGGWANLALDAALPASLSPRDRAFAGALFYGTAERLVTLDAWLAPMLNRPLDKLDVEVRALLETGLYQIHFMKVPAAAAVNEAVALAASFGKKSAGGFVNAVLRRSVSAGFPAGPFASGEEALSVRYSVSPAVAAAVVEALGSEAEAFLQASFTRPQTALRCNTLRTTPAQLAQLLARGGAEAAPGEVPGSLVAKLPGGVHREPLFENGYYHVQGMASQYAAACVGAAPGMQVADLCAAPGGKAAVLAQNMGGGVGLTVCDVNPKRLALAKQLFGRLGLEGAAFREQDAARHTAELNGQDAVLCDVPCSGLGVLAEKPDLRYGDGKGFAALPALQLKILRTASRYVKQGGRLVYSTCTIRWQENADVVRAFLGNAEDFRLIEPPLRPEKAQMDDKMMTILPHNTGLDGFFVATMERL